MSKKLISVVIITCNRKDELKKTILSCAKNAGMPCEIIVIDNGSSDGTREMLKQLQLTKSCRLRPFFSECNLGVSGGRNVGYQMAKSEIIFFIDDDAVIAENSESLSAGYNYMKKHADVHALAMEIYDLKQEKLLLDNFSKKGFNDGESHRMLSYVGASHILRKDKGIQYLYPPKLMYGAEERYAALRAYDMGGEVLYYEGIKVLHNPSTKTRMSELETYRNIMINQFVIKLLLLPKAWLVLSGLLFFLRACRREKFKWKIVLNDYHTAKERYRENIEARYHMRENTALTLMKEFGVFTII
ncbi:MAG: glycosyltransferase family 2 protein [Clostridiaceae bacterium]